MPKLTPSQSAAKARVEAAGGKFIPPASYKKKVYSARTTGSRALNTYRSEPLYTKPGPANVPVLMAKRKNQKRAKEICPDANLLVDQMLNPDHCNEVVRWPNTYGLSAVYKCNTILNPKFSLNKKCCVVVNPTVRDSIFTTIGSATSVTLEPYGSIEDNPTWDPNPFSNQQYDLSNSSDGAYWTSPILLPSREALLPTPASVVSAMVYPVEFNIPSTGTQPIFINFVFDNALTAQGTITVKLYDDDYDILQTVTSGIGAIESPYGVGVKLQLLEPAATFMDDIAFMSIYIAGTEVPYYGNVQMYIDQSSDPEEQGTLIAPNHEQHVVIQDIKDADTIDGSADQAFVLSQSTLITSNFSDLQNGGVIAIARIPGASTVGGGDSGVDANSWYDWISSLSYNQYDGPVKSGAYSWYLPEDETGFFYRPISSYAVKQLPYVVSEFSTTDPDNTALGIRLKVTTIVQFTTTSSVYDCRPSCRMQEADYIHHLLSLVRASYPNDTHGKDLKEGLKHIGNSVVGLLKDPKTWQSVDKIVKGLSAAVL